MNYKLLIFTACFLLLKLSFSQVSEEKYVRKAFSIEKGYKVELSNKYGTVQVLEWNKDSVAVELNQMLQAKNDEKLLKLRNSVDFEFIQAGNYIVIKSVIESSNGRVKGLISTAEDLLSSNNKIKIDVKLYVPSTVKLKIDNKFGDIYLGNLDNEMDIELNHGDLKAGDVRGDLDLEINFGDAEFDVLNGADIEVAFGGLKIEEVNKLKLESKNSDVKIEEVQDLHITAKHSDIVLKEVQLFTGVSSFSDFEVSEVHESISLNAKYGSFKVSQVTEGAKNVQVDTKYTKIDLTFSPSLGFMTTVKYRYATINYPESMSKLELSGDGDKNSTFGLTGWIGHAKSDNQLNINAEHCTVNLKFK